MPMGSMYGIFTYIWMIFVATNRYSIHGAYGMGSLGSENGGTGPEKAIFSGAIPLHRSEKLALYMVGTSI